jgi:hypothetical protein
MRSVLVWGTVGVVLAMFTVNGLVMLISPARWFQLPAWLGLWGSLTKGKYSTGPASVGVRMAGAVFLAVVGFLLFELFLR